MTTLPVVSRVFRAFCAVRVAASAAHRSDEESRRHCRPRGSSRPHPRCDSQEASGVYLGELAFPATSIAIVHQAARSHA